METPQQALQKLAQAWPFIAAECRQVLGSELHYQAMVYYCLRVHAGVPVDQLGMNVKMWIDNPVSALFKELDARKHEDFRGGFEPIPDVAMFSSAVGADWRRRNKRATLKALIAAIEIKASEREKGRLRSGEITADITKLAAHRAEARARGSDFSPIMMVIDTAPDPSERMTQRSVDESLVRAHELSVGFLYLSAVREISTISTY